mmetsp:Transcript_20242/g.40867  ORF Transcript_20242/g.40867 Transcript_20242/m.40867 type:complete len:282 (+) Transcript_20242:182-1027(+)
MGILKSSTEWLSSLFTNKDNTFCPSFFRHAIDHAWKRERPVLKRNYKMLIYCILFQWVHNLSTNIARFLHIPRQVPLYDIGFVLLPSLGENNEYEYLCDVIFAICIGLTVLVWLSPFVVKRTGQSSVVMLSRFMAVLVSAQSLRILTFVMTDLPGPSPRCNPEHQWYNQPKTVVDILWSSCVGFFRIGCGELVFSSRMMLVVLCLLVIAKYGRRRMLTFTFIILAVLYGLMVIAARREYSLSVFIAWYVVPLVWVVYGRNFPDDSEVLPPTRQRNTIMTEP